MEETKMTKTEAVKMAVRVIGSAGAGAVAANIIKFTKPTKQGVLAGILAGIGGLVISSMVMDRADNWLGGYVEDFEEALRDSVKSVNKKLNNQEEVVAEEVK